jgi:hypothetical protein
VDEIDRVNTMGANCVQIFIKLPIFSSGWIQTPIVLETTESKNIVWKISSILLGIDQESSLRTIINNGGNPMQYQKSLCGFGDKIVPTDSLSTHSNGRQFQEGDHSNPNLNITASSAVPDTSSASVKNANTSIGRTSRTPLRTKVRTQARTNVHYNFHMYRSSSSRSMQAKSADNGPTSSRANVVTDLDVPPSSAQHISGSESGTGIKFAPEGSASASGIDDNGDKNL